MLFKLYKFIFVANFIILLTSIKMLSLNTLKNNIVFVLDKGWVQTSL
jgi:hypothetical protein